MILWASASEHEAHGYRLSFGMKDDSESALSTNKESYKYRNYVHLHETASIVDNWSKNIEDH